VNATRNISGGGSVELLTHEQQREVTDAVVAFVKRVAINEKATSAELQALSEVVKALIQS